MLENIIQGFMLGIAFLAPIGMQNLYVINSALSMKRIKAYQVAMITIFFDISLALASFFGIGLLVERFNIFRLSLLSIGSIVLIYIGVNLIRAIPKIDDKLDMNKPLYKIFIMCFSVTWLNPQAIIDGSILLGGIRASLTTEAANLFILGICIASVTWFTGITTIVSNFKKLFNVKVLRAINIACGFIIVYYGLKLGYSFIELVN